MGMQRKYATTFFCFSPPVMIATCIIELSLLAYSMWRYKFTKQARLTAALLLFLAVFQLAEFQVCTGGNGLMQWSRAGFAAIAMMPALGIHFITLVRHQKANKPVVWFAYATAAVFVLYFALTADSIDGHVCLGNYVMFQISPRLTWLFAVYYYGWVSLGMLLSTLYGLSVKNIRRRQAFYGFALGYAVFFIPTITANILDRATMRGIPSIMCGFAVLFALILTLYIMPRVGIVRRRA